MSKESLVAPKYGGIWLRYDGDGLPAVESIRQLCIGHPIHLQFSTVFCAVPKVEIRKILIMDARLCGHRLEVDLGLILQTDGHELLKNFPIMTTYASFALRFVPYRSFS